MLIIACLFFTLIIFTILLFLFYPYLRLKIAIANGEITPHYQMIYNNKKNHFSGMEILSRWVIKEKKHISPETFIPLAEKKGLMPYLTCSIIRQAIEDIESVYQNLPNNFSVSININASQTFDNTLFNNLKLFQQYLDSKGMKLIIEVTEWCSHFNKNDFLESLCVLRQMGVYIALDDFGMHHSNISSISLFNPDMIKIDKYFLTIPDEEQRDILLTSMIELTSKLKIMVVIEGVETEQQVTHMERKGIYLMQGYFFSRPEAGFRLLDTMDRFKNK